MNLQQKQRYNRIFEEDLYLLDKKYNQTNMIFHISGSTANVYKVTINWNNNSIYCSCPDMKTWAASYHCVCKHCCFVIFRVMKCFTLNQTNFFKSLHFSREEINLLKNKFDIMTFNNDDDFINSEYIYKYLNLESEKDVKSISEDNRFIQKRNTKDDEYCIICFEEFNGNNSKNDNDNDNDNKNVECPICHNIIHDKCMKKWIKMGKISCVYCRSDIWINYDKKLDNKKSNNTNYINLLEI